MLNGWDGGLTRRRVAGATILHGGARIRLLLSVAGTVLRRQHWGCGVRGGIGDVVR